MKLTYEGRYEYLKKVYASWLGKVIGVQLGSPVENWTSRQIEEKYPDEEGYLVDYGIYAADDDINGPLFFVRALLDHEEITAEKIGETMLNYLQEYKGFFWWGGIGVSTEHTAYENLKRGIKAPLSGSMKTNGQAIAEQIGGQIFSDCWGYVSGYDPERAKKLAAMASSVTHDRCGIEGGIFVAVAITLAMQKDNIHEVIDEALEYLNKDLEYYRVARDIVHFYENNRDDWKKCLTYIQENYGYDRYPGVCHIIPNSALMIMALCYGEGDFSKTLVMLNRSGWDTDCNCGNVGSILGALVGLKGIEERWITPLNDLLNASSAIGCLNIQYLSQSAKLFTKLAYQLEGIEIEDFPLFVLPYATKAIRCNDGRVYVNNEKLVVESKDICTFAYYLAKDLYDARYDPQFSPILEPGDRVYIALEKGENGSFVSCVRDCEGKEYLKELIPEESGEILIDIPVKKNLVVNRISLRAEYPYAIKDVAVIRKPELEFDFRNYPLDHYGPRYGGDLMSNIRGFVEHSGSWTIEEGLLGYGEEHALISSGCYGNTYRRIRMTFIPLEGEEFWLVFNMKGYLDRCCIGLFHNFLVLKRIREEGEELLAAWRARWRKGKVHRLAIERKDGKLKIALNGQNFEYGDMELRDLFGFALGIKSRCRFVTMKISQ